MMVLTYFTPLEKQSIYLLLCGAMVIDGNRDLRKVAIINEVKQVIEITVADIEASRKLSEPTTTNCLRNMDELKKAYLVKFVCRIVLANGIVNDKEKAFINYYFSLLEIPQM